MYSLPPSLLVNITICVLDTCPQMHPEQKHIGRHFANICQIALPSSRARSLPDERSCRCGGSGTLLTAAGRGMGTREARGAQRSSPRHFTMSCLLPSSSFSTSNANFSPCTTFSTISMVFFRSFHLVPPFLACSSTERQNAFPPQFASD